MPVLIANYQKKSLVAAFKKSYSNIQNAINMVNFENGSEYECYYHMKKGYKIGDCTQFWEAFWEKLNVIETCMYGEGCFDNYYKSKADVIAQGGSQINPSCSYVSYVSTITSAHILSDGSMIIFVNDGHHTPFLALDVNGKKGPNKWGYDLFYLDLIKKTDNKNTTISDNLCAIKEKGGFYPSEALEY